MTMLLLSHIIIKLQWDRTNVNNPLAPEFPWYATCGIGWDFKEQTQDQKEDLLYFETEMVADRGRKGKE